MDRPSVLTALRNKYITARLARVEPEFVDFEESMARDQDLERLLQVPKSSCKNPHNSALLYLVGATDEYVNTEGVDTIDGSPPDIDTDFDTVDYKLIIDWLTEHWGTDGTANIMALQKFKPRGITNKFFAATEPKDEAAKPAHYKLRNEILSKIPPARYGLEPTLAEILDGNDDKRGYDAHPELTTEARFKPWLDMARRVEGMVSTFSIHAAGLVISDFPISDVMPLWFRKTKDEYSDHHEVGRRVTQFTMEEVEKLGLIKFDFLRIDNLSVIKETCRLIQERHNVKIEPWSISETDPKPYKLFKNGLVTGIFQFEASRTAKKLGQRMLPVTLSELSDVTSLNRPGPMEAGLTEQYIRNKKNQYPPSDMPPTLASLLQETYYTLVYQEQIMKILAEIAGFSLKQADDIRRAIGKKQLKKLVPFRQQFIDGLVKSGVKLEYATHFWDKVLVGFASYAFNKSHSIAYTYLSYVCAWLKTYYPMEFFTALMSIRSTTMQPEVWASKAPGYVQEAAHFGITVKYPDINKSHAGFTLLEDQIYFGFSAIRGLGANASAVLEAARGNAPFRTIKDFLDRVDKSKINASVFQQLALAGTFDSLGYKRTELFDAAKDFYEYYKVTAEHTARVIENHMREQENVSITKDIEYRDRLRKKAKKEDLTEEETLWLETNKRIMLKKPLKLPELPVEPTLTRYAKLPVTIPEIIKQGELLGCWINHPAPLVYPDATKIADIEGQGIWVIAGIVHDLKTFKGKNSKTYLTISDGTGTIRVPIYADSNALPKKGALIRLKFKGGYADDFHDMDTEEIKVKATFNLSVYGE